MPAVDMSLEKLLQYQGITPRPENFDEYWENAMQEMRSVSSNVELVKAEYQFPNSECYDMYFTGVRNARIHVKYLRPITDKPTPAMLIFHGYAGSSGDWSSKLSYVNAGFSVFAIDVRGQGGPSQDVGGTLGTTYRGHIVRGLEDSPENLTYRHIFLDTAQLAGIVLSMKEIDASKVMTYGTSQGGALSIVCAALEPRICKAGITHPFLSDYKRTWEMDLTVNAYEELRYFFRNKDPQHKRETEIFTKLGYIDVQNLACRIKADVLFAATLMDTICPPSTQFAAYNKIASKKELVVYHDFAHETPYEHSDIFMQFFTKNL